MDPKGVNGINRLYKEGDILTQGRAQVSPRPRSTCQGGMSNEDFYAEFGDELLVAQRPRLLGQQPLARRPLHGDRQARQPGLSDVRRARRRLPGAGLPARVPDLRQLLGDRQPRGHVARAVPAVAAEASPTPTRSEGNERSPYHDDFALDRIEQALREQNEARAAAAAPAAARARREHALRGPGQLEGAAAGDAVHSRRRFPRSACRSRPRSPWPRSRRASASPRT